MYIINFIYISMIFSFFSLLDSRSYVFPWSIFKNFQMKVPMQISIASEKFVSTAGISDDGVSWFKESREKLYAVLPGLKV